MIKTILFDVDGIVLHRAMNFSEKYSQDSGVPIEKITPFYYNEFQLCLVGKADLKTEIAKYTESWNWTKSVDELLQYWFENEKNVDREFLNHLEQIKARGITCFLQTRNEKYRVDYLWNHIGFKQHFSGIFDSASIGFKKPQIEFWEAIHNQLGQPTKNEVLIWDDDPDNVSSAKEFGFQAQLYTNFAAYKQYMEPLLG